MVHAFVDEPGHIRVRAYADEEALHVVVADDGKGMEPRLDSPGLGLGLPLISQMTRSLAIEPGDGGRGTGVHMCFDPVSRLADAQPVAEGAS